MRAPLQLLAGVTLGCAACSKAPPGDLVQHLDPRLGDGRSATALLRSARKVVREWTFSGGAELESPWRLDDARAEPGPEGLWITGTTPETTRLKRVSLHFLEPSAAPLFDVVELELARTRAGVTRFSWVSTGAPQPSPEPTGQVDVAHGDAEGPITVRIPLADQADWRGSLRHLRIAPNALGPQFFELRAIRFVREGFEPGASPLSQELEDRGSADGGLVARGTDARRVWPTDWGVPLFAREVRMPRGARVEAAATIAPTGRPRGASVRIEIAARDYDGVWKPVAQAELKPGQRLGWVPLVGDLSRRAGERVDLRFLATHTGGTGSPAESLQRANVLFGEPIVYGDPPPKRRPNIVLVTLDTTRADVALEGRFGARTPFLSELAKRSITFANHWSAANSTSPSHASLMTGLAPQDHGVLSNTDRLAPENVTLAEVLRRAGWQTAAAVSVDHLRAERSGLGQGFDRYLGAAEGAPRDGARTIDPVLAWLDGWQSAGERPFFLWVHLFDPHTPYGPPPAFVRELERAGRVPPPKRSEESSIRPGQFTQPGQFLEGVSNLDYARYLYAAGVDYADHQVERLWRRIEEQGLADDTILAVTSDHGESLGEHDVWFIHSGLYAEVLRVPLLLSLPGIPAGRTDELTWSLDLAPTLLEWVGQRSRSEMRGTNLLDVAAGAGPPSRRLWLEHSHLVAVAARDSRWHFIATLEQNEQLGPHQVVAAGTRELFDHVSDPSLQHDLSGTEPDRLAAFEHELEAWRASALSRTRLSDQLTPAERSELRSLGY